MVTKIGVFEDKNVYNSTRVGNMYQFARFLS